MLLNIKHPSRISIILFLFIIGCSCFISNVFASQRQTPVVEVVRENAETVVNISTEHIVLLQENPYWGGYGDEFDLLFEQFFGGYSYLHALKLKSVGSGVILESRGIIITNAHVVNMASDVFVILSNGVSVEGEVVYEDLKQDLAIIKISPPHPLQEIKLGKPQDIMIGETAIAIGNPLGLENSVTVGVVSGKQRELYLPGSNVICKELIQTDAPINPGNSGGALFNLDGELIGINVAVVQDSQSIGFAIPVENIRESLDNYLNQESNINSKQSSSQSLNNSHLALLSKENNSGSTAEAERAEKEINQFFQNIFNYDHESYTESNDSESFYNSALGIQDKDTEYVLEVDISNLDKDTVNIEIKEEMVIISAVRSVSKEESSKNYLYTTESHEFYSNIIPLPADANTKKAKTILNQDTLTIVFPKG